MPRSPTDPSPRFALAYPIAFFGLAFVLCAWILHGNRIFSPVLHAVDEIASNEAP